MAKQKVNKWVTIVLLFAVGVVAGVVGAKFSVSSSPLPPEVVVVTKFQGLITVLLSLGGAFFLGVLLHELGHVAGGLVARFQFWTLIVGAFKLSRVRGQLRLGLNRTLSQALGLVMFRLPDTHRLRPRMLLLIAGGPVASGLAALLGFGVLHGTGLDAYLTRSAPFPNFALATFTLVFAWVNVLMFAVSAFPAEAGGFYTDGARLRNFLRAANRPNLDVAFTEMYVSLAAGARPRSFSPERWEALMEFPENSLYKVYCRFYAYYTVLDREELPQAQEYLEQVLAHLPRINPFSRKGIAMEAAFFYAYFRNDLPTGKKYLAQGQGPLMDEHLLYLAEAAVLWAESRPEAAGAKASAGLALLPFAYNRGLAQFHGECLQELVSRSQRAKSIG